ncbi:MAG: aminopeptidase [Akkermansiaceae bacterium]
MRAIWLLYLLLLTNCQKLSFYTQGTRGQLEILRKSTSNKTLITSPDTSDFLKQRLLLAEELCSFATEELDLPGESAYHKYADLGRDHVVFVIYAAPEFSLEPKKWFYPIVGEMVYRGYFNKDDAEAYARSLREQGFEVHLGGTDAYSTLGFFHDPILNTFVDYPEIDFAETIFHELTHRRIFVKGDTTFNESLANAVAEEGIRRWLISKGRTGELDDYEERLIRRRDFYQQIEITKTQLEQLYASKLPEEDMRKRKQDILKELKKRADELQRRWGGKQLEEWLKIELTNAHLLSLATYNEQIPRFRKLLSDCGGDFRAFFEKVEKVKKSDEPLPTD